VRLYRTDEGQAAVRAWCEERLVGHARSTISTALGETSLVTAGDTGPLVVLVPGTNLNAATTTGLIDALAADHRVVAVDLPGQPGLSAAEGPVGDRMTGYGAWLDEVLAGLGEAAVLVGHSMGAAAVLAATPGTRVGGIVLVDPAGFTRPALGIGLLGAFVAWLARPGEASSGRLVQRMLAEGHPPGEELVDWFTLIGRRCRSTGAPGPSDPAVVRRWAGTPRAVLVGEQDTFFPPRRLGPIVQERLGVEPTVVAGTGHLLPEEDPRAVVETVRRTSRP
jgi:pimeloyl-ACP methyl ester carboxylesterase